jgi:hypothetical protein
MGSDLLPREPANSSSHFLLLAGKKNWLPAPVPDRLGHDKNKPDRKPQPNAENVPNVTKLNADSFQFRLLSIPPYTPPRAQFGLHGMIL